MSGSWVRPLGVTLAGVLTAVAAVHHHRDAGSLLAAFICLGLVTQTWRHWLRERSRQRSDRTTPHS